MKQIFDWLREQIDKYSYDTETCGGRYIDIIEEKDVVRLVNEAEAKWEEEVCEWKQEEIEELMCSTYYTSCGNTIMFSTGTDKYCKCCGKPIKISEVE